MECRKADPCELLQRCGGWCFWMRETASSLDAIDWRDGELIAAVSWRRWRGRYRGIMVGESNETCLY